MVHVRTAGPADRDALAEMRATLWPESAADEHARELDAIFAGAWSVSYPYCVLVADDDDGRIVGFAEVTIRSRADGCDPTRPVGFLEGWFVRDDARRRGVGVALMRAAEAWSREQGCVEMASDTWLDNDASVTAHERLGFEVVDRVVNFRKTLAPAPEQRPLATVHGAAGWASRYFEAWRTNDAALVESLFAPDAVYWYGPFRPPSRGREEILRRWTGTAQEHVQSSFEVVGVSGDTAAIHFRIAFMDGPRRVEMDGVLVVRFDAAGRCVEHREWYAENLLPSLP